MEIKVLVLLVTWLGCIYKGASKADCSLKFSKESEQHQPIILNNRTSRYTFIIPEEGVIALREEEKFTLACSSPRNILLLSNSNATTATCVRGNRVRVANKIVAFDEIQCKTHVTGDVTQTEKHCGNSLGRIIDIGYHITRRDWITLIQVCYDSRRGNPLYTEHVLHGEALQHASKTSFRPSFQVDGLGPKVSASVAYKKQYQKSTLNKLLGSAKLAARYIHEKSYLARGHLSPDADFIFAPWQYTTYYYINTVPQWQVINAGNWKSAESMVRKIATAYKQKMRVITGSYGILSLPDENEKMQDIYLVSSEKLPVPKYIYKIIYLESTDKAIAIVVLNNPFVEQITNEDYLCEDVCEKYGWHRDNWLNAAKGFIHCCDVRDLRKVVNTIPNLTVTGILRCPLRRSEFDD